MPSLDVVIPTLNAAGHLRDCLTSLRGGDVDGVLRLVLIADGGSEDDTRAIADAHGLGVVDAARGRGTQLAAGADAAGEDWLLFLHADTRLPRRWSTAFLAAVARYGEARAFYGRFHLDSLDWRARLIEAGVAWRCRWQHLPYGDQGLWIHRQLYREVGGYPDWPLFEDVALVERLGRERLALLPINTLTSAVRYRRDGFARRVWRNRQLMRQYRRGTSPHELARAYRSGDPAP